MENKLHVYHISQIDLGDSFEFRPDIPKFKSEGEDRSIRRIYVCTSIASCITAIDNIPYTCQFAPNGLDLWLYEADINIEDIYQPTDKQVSDAWHTGELWVTYPYVFTKTEHYLARKHMEIPNSWFSRYSFTADGEEEVLDRICDDIIYGDRKAFSMLLADRDREREALDHWECYWRGLV